MAEGDGGRLLAEVMSLNAIFSTLSGLALATGAPPLAGWLGLPVWLVSSLGLGLLGFAVVLVWLLATPHRLRTGAWFVVAADLAWIVGAVLLIGLFPRALPPSGEVALTGSTLVVAALAAGQLGGVARTGARSVSGTFPLDVAAERLVPAGVDRARGSHRNPSGSRTACSPRSKPHSGPAPHRGGIVGCHRVATRIG